MNLIATKSEAPKPRRGKLPGEKPKHGRQKLTDSFVKSLGLPASGV